ncbi:MAG: type II toxin-antitoxin system VapC family toxin [Gemmataceae bacterium]|nr:type II toxin-antitoxin system VapC family toxin [Gemmataceae bacterium]
MIVLDTDCMTILERADSEAAIALRAKIHAAGEEIICAIVTVEERLRGWLAAIAAAKNEEMLRWHYANLERFLIDLQQVRVIPYNAAASAVFEGLRAKKIRVGTMDMRIAAIAVSQDATLVSRNLKDFKKIPGLKVEDWIGARQ